jgi:hypothetical protein
MPSIRANPASNTGLAAARCALLCASAGSFARARRAPFLSLTGFPNPEPSLPKLTHPEACGEMCAHHITG